MGEMGRIWGGDVEEMKRRWGRDGEEIGSRGRGDGKEGKGREGKPKIRFKRRPNGTSEVWTI